MAALTHYREGWPFYQLADTGKVTLGQQRAWLFFLVVQLAGITVGIMDELTRQRISPEKPLDEGDRLQQTLSVKSDRKSHISSFTSRQVCIDAATLPIGRSYAEDVRTRLHAPKIPHSW
jgi:hypothetical protein